MASAIASEEIHEEPPRIPWWRKLFYSLIVFLILFGVPEGVLRVAGIPAETDKPELGSRQFVDWLSSMSLTDFRKGQLYQQEKRLVWRLNPGAVIDTVNFHHASDGEAQPIRITINSDGHRGRQITPESEQADLRILCMGDSEFFGYPLDDSHAFPCVLEQKLAEKFPGKKIEVINGGCPGFSSAQGWKWYEEQFADYPYDWLLICYLNNDAWRNAVTDKEMMKQAGSPLAWLVDIMRESHLLQMASSLNAIPEEEYVNRVPIDECLENHQRLIESARKRGAKVLIVDYCAYDSYLTYSKRLSELASTSQVNYFSVIDELAPIYQDPNGLDPYEHLLPAVQRRWGEKLLFENPHLWFFAEHEPVHLNEVGNAWLVGRLAALFDEADAAIDQEK